MAKLSEIVSAQQRRAPEFLAPICTRPAQMPDGALPGAWLPHGDDARPVIPGDVVRQVRGYNVHCIDGEDYLSTGTVLSIMRWGDVSHVPPVALEYGRERGSYVDRACRCLDAGCLDWAALDDRLKPYVEAWNWFVVREPWYPGTTEALVRQPWFRTFGYTDRCGFWGTSQTPVVLDIKTSDHIGTSYRLQLASYLTGPRDHACAVQLKKDGTYQLHWLEHAMQWRQRFERLAHEAHEYIREEEQRAAEMRAKRRATR
jgi:hypothetical protein